MVRCLGQRHRTTPCHDQALHRSCKPLLPAIFPNWTRCYKT
uniref:Uncharacterized protein n=1 Tax=Anopheles maculatus TaxID=74869 RepID=A0A182T7M5_9DIPT